MRLAFALLAGLAIAPWPRAAAADGMGSMGAMTDAGGDPDVAKVMPCRPTVTCMADLAPVGTLELELGYEFHRSGGIDVQTFPVLVKLPVASWLELQAGDAGYTITPADSYLDNFTLGVKLHLADQRGARPSLAVTATASLPGPSQAGYAHVTDGFLVAQASKDYGKLHLDANVGVDAWRLGGPVLYQPYAAVAASLPVTDSLSATIEPHAFSDASPIAARDVGAIAAVAFTARPNLIIDAAVDVTAIEPRAIAGIVGVSIAPARLWRKP